MPPGPDEQNEGGLEVVLSALREESFPMDKDELYYAVGDLAVTDAEGRIVSVREVLDRTDKSRFQSVDDVAHTLRSVIVTEEARLPPG
jgi:hypothetical protein